MTTTSLPQDCFEQSVKAYFATYEAGERDMSILGPLVKKVDACYVWTPKPPAPPLTPDELDATLAAFHTIEPAMQDRLDRVFAWLETLPRRKRDRLIDLWIDTMKIMVDD